MALHHQQDQIYRREVANWSPCIATANIPPLPLGGAQPWLWWGQAGRSPLGSHSCTRPGAEGPAAPQERTQSLTHTSQGDSIFYLEMHQPPARSQLSPPQSFLLTPFSHAFPTCSFHRRLHISLHNHLLLTSLPTRSPANS